jgi:plastocyanin
MARINSSSTDSADHRPSVPASTYPTRPEFTASLNRSAMRDVYTAMTNQIRRLAVVASTAMAIMALLLGCGTSTSTTPASDSAATGASATPANMITISNFAFGGELTVAPGATVTVINKDSAQHNVTATDGSFKTANLKQGESATFTAPTKPGRYAFTCTIHPQMTGALVVGAAGGATTAPAGTGGGGGGY